MTNNYILRRLRYTFDFNDNTVISIFAKGNLSVTREQISAWMKKDDDPDYVRCTDQEFAHFLNGLIIEKRGAKDDQPPKAEFALNNNIILRKLKIAFNMIDQDILDLLDTANFRLGKSELSAFFRKPDHRHYRECQNQVLRNVLQGLEMKFKKTSTAQKQSKYQAIKSTNENKKEKQKLEGKKKGHQKPFKTKDKPSEKVVYHNPKKKRDDKPKREKLSLKKTNKDNTSEADSGFAWKPLDQAKNEK